MTESKPTTIVIFGASGDLTSRKLMPALFSAYQKGRLPARLKIVGCARTEWDDATFRTVMRDGAQEFGAKFDERTWNTFAPMLHFKNGDLTVAADFEQLKAMLPQLEGGPANRLYYLAVAPRFFAPTIANLGTAGLASQEEGKRNLVIEKPFGHSLQSARALNQVVHQVFEEPQVYRIDHYLGKETAQNILFFRFFNTIFEPVWNRNYVDNIQITAAESVDVGHRAGYYDQAGVLRDMFQNHMLQLLSLVTMEPPASFQANDVRNEKVKVLQAIRPVNLQDTVRAQYDGYCQAEGVAENSQTATFAALKLYIDNWRWNGVPIYLRSGKALPQKTTEIIIEFQKPPHQMFDLPPDYDFTPNRLAICIQPDEGIHLKFETKVPDAVGENAFGGHGVSLSFIV